MKFLNPFIVVVLLGSVLWFGAGLVTGMGSFEYKGSVHEDLSADEMENFEEYSSLAFRVGTAWALCGGVAGLIIMLWFSIRPDFEHRTLMPPPMPPPPGLPGAGSQTLAELHTMPVALLVGIVGGLLLSMFYIPTMELPDQTVLKSGMMRNAVGCISTVIATIPILPFSKSILQRVF